MEETGKPGLYEAHGASIQRYTAPATYIHTPPHTRTHTHTDGYTQTNAKTPTNHTHINIYINIYIYKIGRASCRERV